MIKRIFLLCFLALIVCLPTLPGRAQDAVTLSTLDISLWPEYDQPSLLVIYKAQISPVVSLPAEITFLIPAQAVEPTAVAVGLDADSVADIVYEVNPAGEWVQVSFIATTPAVQLEYYDPRLIIDGNQRTFNYTWPGDYAVDLLTVDIQHPVGSSAFTVTPEAGNQLQDTQGFVYNVIDKGSQPAGADFTVSVSYQKETDELSAQDLPIMPSAPLAAPTSARLNLGQALPWILGFLGVALIVGGGIWYWQSGKQPSTEKSRRRRRTASSTVSKVAPEGEGVYCHNCGKRATASDRFCRTCGTKLRIE